MLGLFKPQPMALILNKAIDDAKMKGYKYWNWGGTWFSQKEFLDLKKMGS